jgi:hypothetical protein
MNTVSAAPLSPTKA